MLSGHPSNIPENFSRWNFQESYLDAHLTPWWKVPKNPSGGNFFIYIFFQVKPQCSWANKRIRELGITLLENWKFLLNIQQYVGNELFKTIITIIFIENHLRIVDCTSYSIWDNVLGIRMGHTSNGAYQITKKSCLYHSFQAVSIMRIQNRYFKIWIYQNLSIYLMSSVWNLVQSFKLYTARLFSIYVPIEYQCILYRNQKPGSNACFSNSNVWCR